MGLWVGEGMQPQEKTGGGEAALPPPFLPPHVRGSLGPLLKYTPPLTCKSDDSTSQFLRGCGGAYYALESLTCRASKTFQAGEGGGLCVCVYAPQMHFARKVLPTSGTGTVCPA